MLTFLYSAGIGLGISASSYHLLNLWKRRTLYYGMIFMSQVFWMTYLIVRCAGTWTTWTSGFDGSVYFFFALGSLTSILNTLHFLLDIWKAPTRWYWTMYVTVFVLHGLMNWNHYTRFNLINLSHIFTRDFVAIVTRINLAWLCMMYILDCFPPLYIVAIMLTGFHATFKEKYKAVWNGDKWFVILYVLQLCDLVLFITQDQLRSNSELLGNDRVWLSFISVEAFCLAVHGFLNTLIIERTIIIVRERKVKLKRTS
jgi:hypothetical protein